MLMKMYEGELELLHHKDSMDDGSMEVLDSVQVFVK